MPFLSHTHFSLNIDRNDGTISVTDYSRNGTYIKRNKTITETKNDDAIVPENIDTIKNDDNNKDFELIGSNKTSTINDGDSIVLRFKQENKLTFNFKLEPGIKLHDGVGVPPNGSPTVLSGEDSLQSQVTTLLAENSKQERIIAENVAKSETLSKELLSLNRELANLQTTLQSKDTTIAEFNETIAEFESVSAAKNARIHQCEEQLETLKQENAELMTKHSIITEDLSRKTELIEKRDELINQSNKAYEVEKKLVLELSDKLEEEERKNYNSVNMTLALQDLIKDRSYIDEKMVKNNTDLYELLKRVTVAKANDNEKKMNTNNQLVSILKQCLELVPDAYQSELDAVLGAVDLQSYEKSIREHVMLVETPTQASIVDNGVTKGSSLHTLTTASMDENMEEFSVKVRSDVMEVEENYVEVTKISEYHSSDTDSDEDKCSKWDRLMMMTTQMPQDVAEFSSDDADAEHEHESAKDKNESVNSNESQFVDDGSLKGSLLDVGFSNDSLKNNNNEKEEEKFELNKNLEEEAPAVPPSQNTQTQVKNVLSELLTTVDENDRMQVVQEGEQEGEQEGVQEEMQEEVQEELQADVKENVRSPSSAFKRTADNDNNGSSEKKAKFHHEVTIINENNAYTNIQDINMSYHCESTCASLDDN